ncbi:Increased DNA methylation 1-like protein [Drosera capensis]
MKRELSFALSSRSQILDSNGRTRSNKTGGGGEESRDRKRAKKAKKAKIVNDCSVIEIEEAKIVSSACNGVRVADDGRNHSTGSSENDEIRIGVESALVEEKIKFVCEEKSTTRRFTRSVLGKNGDVLDRKEEKTGEEEVKGGLSTELEDKESELGEEKGRQIFSNKIPTTVKELLETGMLEGYGVYYNHVNKGPGLRGTISGTGILCSCSSCNGCRVVSHTVFELHANHVYKRAVEYVCLENGRSFIQILKACRRSRLDTLEATIREAIGPPPEKVMIVCHSCNESLATNDAYAKSRCDSCTKSELSPAAASPTDCETSRSSESVGSLKSSEKRAKINASGDDQAKVVTRVSKSAVAVEFLKNSAMMESPARTGCKKILPRPSTALSAPEPSGSPYCSKLRNTSASRSSTSKRSKKSKLQRKTPGTVSSVSSSKAKVSWKITQKDLRMHKLVFEDGALPDGTELSYYAGGKKMLDGYKKGNGIFCLCCNSVVSASQFEAHAGCAARRKPYCYIYTSNGVSLHELSISLASKHTFKESDDYCKVCGDGGELVICDLCPRVFHPECASLEGIPRGKWYCPYCQNMFHRESFVAYNANAIAAGRVSGADPIKEISKRCIRIVNDFETDPTACVLCRVPDYSKSKFGPRTIILCDQCEKEFHVGCLKDHEMADLKELPKGNWFCTSDCVRIHSALQNLLVTGPEVLDDSLTAIIRKKHMQNGPENVGDVNASWRIINGKKNTSNGTKELLLQAISIFHDGFSPIVDGRTGCDLIPAMVYGNMRGLEYKGMYCAVLTVNTVVVSAAVFRIFGTEVAELPLVATINGSHGKGYFQTLYGCVERLLASLEVKNIVLPAAEEAKAIWTEKFGFRKMTPDQISRYRKNCLPMLFFQGTVMLEKAIP